MKINNRRTNYREIAAETLEIIENGCYEQNGKKISLGYTMEQMEHVDVITPRRIQSLLEDEEGYRKEPDQKQKSCEYRVVNMDSYEANRKFAENDHTLVMNFANAHHPGGGFLNGAAAQEECLCRCSSLFASISSRKAGEMYSYNNANLSPFDSDYMLLSPYVSVFRDAACVLQDKVFHTSVVTIAAPNLNGLARGVDQREIAAVMKHKIEGMLCVALSGGYDVLVLGAWGCGAFGNDAEDVADYFKEILLDKGYFRYFKKIIFANYDKTPGEYNYRSFIEVFGESGIWSNQG